MELDRDAWPENVENRGQEDHLMIASSWRERRLPFLERLECIMQGEHGESEAKSDQRR